MENKKKKFVLAFSGGKDCTLALDMMIEQGHQPVALMMCLKIDNTAHMHQVDIEVLKRYQEALGIPMIFYKAMSHRETSGLREAVLKAKGMGADTVVTGDIALESIRQFNQRMCDEVGMELICPLWEMNRQECLDRLIDRGYKAMIIGIWKDSIPQSYLGRYIDKEIGNELKQYGIDITGENGEYHTMTVDGPIFKKPLELKIAGQYIDDWQSPYLKIE